MCKVILSSINLKGMEVPIVAVCKYPYLISVFMMLCANVYMFIVSVHGACSGCVFVHVLDIYVHVCLGYVCLCACDCTRKHVYM